MTVTMRDVLRDEVLRRAEPVVEAGRDGLDRTVRWAYTNERYDVASFLSGGELLIIEGSALLAHMTDAEIVRYVDALADARAGGVVIELVQGVRRVPEAMRRRADERALPVVGLYARQPFVDLCQSINTAIVRERLTYRSHVDVLSSDLRRALAGAATPGDVVAALADLLGEGATMVAADGTPLASSGPAAGQSDSASPEGGDGTVTMAVERNGNPLASIELTQRLRLFDAESLAAVRRCVEACVPRVVRADVGVAMVARLLRGPGDGVCAADDEARDAATMLRAVGVAEGAAVMPFAVSLRTLRDCAGVVASLRECARGIGAVSLALRGGAVMGLLASQADGGAAAAGDAGHAGGAAGAGGMDGEACADGVDGIGAAGGGAVFESLCRRRLADVARRHGVWVVAGQAAPDARALVNAAGMVDWALRSADARPGSVTRAAALALTRFAACDSMPEACAMLCPLMLPGGVLGDPSLTATLAACFDVADNKTEACARLGIRRQTLYNRLDKVSRLTLTARDDVEVWPLMLFAAKLALARGRTPPR